MSPYTTPSAVSVRMRSRRPVGFESTWTRTGGIGRAPDRPVLGVGCMTGVPGVGSPEGAGESIAGAGAAPGSGESGRGALESELIFVSVPHFGPAGHDAAPLAPAVHSVGWKQKRVAECPRPIVESIGDLSRVQ